MGFSKSQEDGNPGVLGKVLKSSLTDVLVLNPKKIKPQQIEEDRIKIEKIGIYVHSFRHLNLMLTCAAAVAERRRARIIIFGFLPPDYTKL